MAVIETDCRQNAAAPITRLAKHIPQLDGIRGIAVLAVMCIHMAVRLRVFHLHYAAQYGWIGVDLFFVLSGFLITGILVDSRESDCYFKNFYARRALRIWPLYYGLLLLAFGVLPLIAARISSLPSFTAADTRGFWVYALYVQNMTGGGKNFCFLLGVTWSLAIEEQFYLVWPLVVRILNRRALVGVLVAILFATPILRAIAFHHNLSSETVYTNTLLRLDGLAAGALIALLVRSASVSVEQLKKLSWAAFLFGSACVVVLRPAWIGGPPASAMAYSALTLAFAGFLGVSLTSVKDAPITRFLSLPPLRYAGQISFCLYLIHLPIFNILNSNVLKRHCRYFADSQMGDIVALVVGFGAAFLIASLSWHVVERPILSWKSRFQNSTESAVRRIPPQACESD